MSSAALKAVRYRSEGRTIVQRTKIADSLGRDPEKARCINAQADPSISEPVADPAAT